MSTQLQRVQSPEIVVTIAKANNVSYSLNPWAASVTLSNGVAYYWTAA